MLCITNFQLAKGLLNQSATII